VVPPFYRHGHRCREARAPLNIAVFNWRDIRHPKAGGAEAYLHEQARYWVQWGHRVRWFGASFADAPSIESVDGVEIYRSGGEFSVYAHAPLAYARYMRDADVLIDAENGIPFFTPLFSRIPKTLLMFHLHRDVLLRELPVPMNWLAWGLEAWLMPFLYRGVPIVAISESTRDDIVKYRYTRLPIAVVRSGVTQTALGTGPKALVPTICPLYPSDAADEP